MVVRRVYPLWDRPSFVVFQPESEGGVGPREVPDGEGSAWCEQATDGDVHLIGDVRGRNQVPAALGGIGLACHDLYRDAQGGLSLSWRRVNPKNSRGYPPRLKKRSRDKKSVDKEVTEPSKQLKRTVMHCVQINAKILRQS